MIFIDITKLNELHEKFQLHKQDNEDFQGFAEKKTVEEQAVVDTEPCTKFLHQMLQENHRYLLTCEEEDLRWFGDERINRVNFLKQLVGEKDRLRMQDIKDERKRLRMGFVLIELKTDTGCCEFIIKNTISNRILNWGGMPEAGTFKQYLSEHPWPKDMLYSEQQFLNDAGSLSGCMHLKVESKDTAEFIRAMIYELS